MDEEPLKLSRANCSLEDYCLTDHKKEEIKKRINQWKGLFYMLYAGMNDVKKRLDEREKLEAQGLVLLSELESAAEKRRGGLREPLNQLYEESNILFYSGEKRTVERIIRDYEIDNKQPVADIKDENDIPNLIIEKTAEISPYIPLEF